MIFKLNRLNSLIRLFYQLGTDLQRRERKKRCAASEAPPVRNLGTKGATATR